MRRGTRCSGVGGVDIHVGGFELRAKGSGMDDAEDEEGIADEDGWTLRGRDGEVSSDTVPELLPEEWGVRCWVLAHSTGLHGRDTAAVFIDLRGVNVSTSGP